MTYKKIGDSGNEWLETQQYKRQMLRAFGLQDKPEILFWIESHGLTPVQSDNLRKELL
jgi:hypothetical protein